MRTAVLATMLFVATPGQTAGPTVDQALAYYQSVPWLAADTPEGRMYCLPQKQAESVDVVVAWLAKRAKDVCS